MKEKSRERYKNLSQEEKDKIKEYQKKKYQELIQYKRNIKSHKFKHYDDGFKYFSGYLKGEIITIMHYFTSNE